VDFRKAARVAEGFCDEADAPRDETDSTARAAPRAFTLRLQEPLLQRLLPSADCNFSR
jgi:hypothetical protein